MMAKNCCAKCLMNCHYFFKRHENFRILDCHKICVTMYSSSCIHVLWGEMTVVGSFANFNVGLHNKNVRQDENTNFWARTFRVALYGGVIKLLIPKNVFPKLHLVYSKTRKLVDSSEWNSIKKILWTLA